MVWESFAQTRSVRATAEATGIGYFICREVIRMDQDRLLALIDGHIEQLVSQWEAKHQQAHTIMGDLLSFVGSMVAEIKAAAAGGRPTTILGSDGHPMFVLDAVQFLVMSRTLDQLMRLAGQAHEISTAYRTPGRVQGSGVGGQGSEGQQRGQDYDFARMDDAQLAGVIRSAGLSLPPVLERKVKLIESQSRKVDKSA